MNQRKLNTLKRRKDLIWHDHENYTVTDDPNLEEKIKKLRRRKREVICIGIILFMIIVIIESYLK